MKDFRTLCDKAVQLWAVTYDMESVIDEMRFALAQPEPEGPTDEELLAALSQAVASFPPIHPEAKALSAVEYDLELEIRKARAVIAADRARWDRALEDNYRIEMGKQEALKQLEQMRDRQEKRMEYYHNLIRDGEELTPIEISNAKKLLRMGYAKTLEIGKAVVRRNRDVNPNWNNWFYNRFARRPDEDVETAEDT